MDWASNSYLSYQNWGRGGLSLSSIHFSVALSKNMWRFFFFFLLGLSEFLITRLCAVLIIHKWANFNSYVSSITISKLPIQHVAGIVFCTNRKLRRICIILFGLLPSWHHVTLPVVDFKAKKLNVRGVNSFFIWNTPYSYWIFCFLIKIVC